MELVTSTCNRILHLPPELLEVIVLSPVLSVPDVFRLSGVCRLLHQTVSRQWEKLARSRWSSWDEVVAGGNAVDWRALVCQRYLCEERLKALMDRLMDVGACAPLLDDHDLRGFSDIMEETASSFGLMECVLRDVFRVPPKCVNLTHQFYSLYGREHLHRKHLEGMWSSLLELPEAQQHLESGAILLAQWMNPWSGVSSESILGELDDIAVQVARKILAKQMSGGSICPPPTLSSSELMSRVQCLGLGTCAVLDELNAVLYGPLGFRPSSQEEYYDDSNSYIDQVLKQKRGLPITMSIVYHSVARRLGVTLLPVNFPSHFLLKLGSSQEREAGGTQDAIFIDAYNGGTRRTRVQCLELLPVLLPSVSPLYFTTASLAQVCMRMAGNLCSNSTLVTGMELRRLYNEQMQQWGCLRLPQALSLQLFLCSKVVGRPFALDYTLSCTSLCINLNYSPVPVLRLLDDVIKSGARATSDLILLRHSAEEAVKKKEELCSSLSQPKRRVPSLKYHIGMIARNIRYGYRCVVYGWDECCEMDESWMVRMRVDQLQMGRRQPFYHVLVEDGTTRYAAQENLEPSTPFNSSICHWELGRYFESFTGRGYVPNRALRNIYCEDCG